MNTYSGLALDRSVDVRGANAEAIYSRMAEAILDWLIDYDDIDVNARTCYTSDMDMSDVAVFREGVFDYDTQDGRLTATLSLIELAGRVSEVSNGAYVAYPEGTRWMRFEPTSQYAARVCRKRRAR